MSPKVEHVLLLGATGVSGLAFIAEVNALPSVSRPKLTLYVRSRVKLSATIQSDPGITIVEGALNDVKTLTLAMEGVTTVISFLGAYMSFSNFVFRRTSPTPIADSFPAIFDAMRAKGVTRIMVLSTATGYPVKGETLSWKWWILGLIPLIFVPLGNAEMKGIGENVAGQEDLEWTIFRVPHLNDGDAGLEVAAGLLGQEYRGGVELSRRSQARWVSKELNERKWIKGAPMLGNC